MHISEISIKKYGKFEDFKLPLKSGFNLIYGENEAGKTTLNSFIRRMFYGMALRDRSGVKTNDRARYMPFSGGNMSGSLKLDLGSGENIVISRTFGRTAAADRLSIVNDATGEEISKFAGESVGEILFGCSDGMFEKTLWLRQNGTYMGGSDDEITRRLINLATSGDEEVSASLAAENLATLQKSLKAADNRSAPGKIDKLQRELNELTDEKLRLERKRETLAEYEQKYAALQKERAGIERTIEEYKRAQTAVEAKQKFDVAQKIDEYSAEIEELKTTDDYINYIDIDEARKFEISEKNRELEEFGKLSGEDVSDDVTAELEKARKKKRLRVLAFIFGGIAAIGGGAAYGFTANWHFSIIVALGLAIWVLALLDLRKIKCLIAEWQSKIDAIAQSELDKKSKFDILNQELCEIYRELNVTGYGDLLEKSANAARIKAKIELLRENIQVLLDGKDLEQLRQEASGYEQSSQIFESNKAAIDRTLNNGQSKLLFITEQIQDMKRSINMLFAGEESLAAITSNIAKNKEEIEELKLQLAAVMMAREELANAANEMKNNFTPPLNSAANEVIKGISNGKYSDLRVSEELSIKVLQDDALIEGEYLSAGAFDQIYFALRMAVVELLCGENKILFLDDTFTQYDDVRAKAAFDYILKISRECQVVMFTCQSRELFMARERGNINVITI
ncbi:MAG: AAA family ATPase [Oscillospiraceae bacterium]|nr:AAA family ATPase [Oscillospiraceae bacterium]